jgi:hypothetical protein
VSVLFDGALPRLPCAIACCTAPAFCNNQAAICREVLSPIASLCASIGVR